MHTLPLLTIDSTGRSVFAKSTWPNEMRSEMSLSPRIATSSLRLRVSEPGYFANWHMAGPADEPVMIVVQKGTLRIGLRGGTHHDFSAGEAFIANDSLGGGVTFDETIHGHTAEVISGVPLHAIHIKLAGALVANQ